MRNKFPGYFTPTADEFKALWTGAIFSCDANVLLNLYRYKPETRSQFLSVLGRAKQRLWVTNQAALEFLRNRMTVIQSQIDAFDRVGEELKRSRNELAGRVSEFSRHSAIDVKQLSSGVDEALEKAIQELGKLRAAEPDLASNDPILAAVVDLFDGRVGDPFTEAELPVRLKAIDDRYAKQIPPGYMDKAKSGDRQYGDCLVWLQLLDRAKAKKTPIIFITDDLKDDWWLRQNGRTLGPRPELVDEMSKTAGVKFYMYSADAFLQFAAKFFEEEVDKAALRDVRSTQRRPLSGVPLPSPEESWKELVSRVARKRVFADLIRKDIARHDRLIERVHKRIEQAGDELDAATANAQLAELKSGRTLLLHRLERERFGLQQLEERLSRSFRVVDGTFRPLSEELPPDLTEESPLSLNPEAE